MKQKQLPYNLQFFAEGDGGTGDGNQNQQQNQQNQQQNQQQNNNGGAIDYEKLASIVQGKQQVTEDTVLKSYFKQQGLSQEDAQKAMAAFKAEQEKNKPDVTALQSQITAVNQALLQSALEKEALVIGAELGIEMKTMPYILKLADLSAAAKDGKPDVEALKAAINKVLEDVPALKTKKEDNNGGFQVGGSGQNNQQQNNNNNKQKDTVAGRFRFN